MSRIYLSIIVSLFYFLSYGQSKIDHSPCSSKIIDDNWVKVSQEISTNQFDKAIPILEEMRRCADQLSDETNSAYIHNMIGYSYMNLGEYESMRKELKALEKQINSKVSVFDDKTGIKADLYYLLGEYYRLGKGLNEVPLNYYQKTVNQLLAGQTTNAVLDESELDFSFKAGDVFNNAAIRYRRLGDYERAASYYDIALQLAQSSFYTNWEKANFNQNLAFCYQHIYKKELALKHYKNALALLEKKKEDSNYTKIKSVTYKNLSSYYDLLGKPDSAYFYIYKALELNPNPKFRISTIQTYISILLKDGKYQEALEKIKESVLLTQKTYGILHSEMAENYRLNARLLVAQSKFEEATIKYDNALQVLSGFEPGATKDFKVQIDRLSDKRLVLTILHEKAKALAQDRKWGLAIKHFELINKLIKELQFKYIINEESRFFLAQEAKNIYEDAIEIAIQAKNIKKAYQFSQQSRGLLLLQQVQHKKAIELASLPDSIVQEEQQLKIEINLLLKQRKEAVLKNDFKKIDQVARAIIELELNYQKWVEKIKTNFPIFYQLAYKLPTSDLALIQQYLKDKNATLVEYFWGEKNLYTFIINENQIQVLSYSDIKKLKELTNEFFVLVKNPKLSVEAYRNFKEIAHSLYSILLQKPIDQNFIKHKELIIIPDEQLNLMPFQALMKTDDRPSETSNDYHYLVEEYFISYLYSSNLISYFINTNNSEKDEDDFLGIAPKFENLKYNVSEIEQIQAICGGDILKNDKATYSNLKEKINDKSIVHFATHALFNDEVPLDSRIVLADTALYIYEIYTLKHKMEMAVISACETARGKQKKGEGVVSLARSFVQSGCPSIVASLWSVSDQKTSMLMENFYLKLSEGHTKSEAFALAQRNYLDIGISSKIHPFYWAGFVQIGDFSPLGKKEENHLTYLLFILVILPIIAFLYFSKKIFI